MKFALDHGEKNLIPKKQDSCRKYCVRLQEKQDKSNPQISVFPTSLELIFFVRKKYIERRE